MVLTVRVGLGVPPSVRTDVDALYDYLAAIEELEYDSLWVSDAIRPRGLAALPVLAAAAARTTRLKLGMAVLALPWRPPMTLAHELATIDALSGGRLLPAGGLGAGRPSDFAAVGVGATEKVARMEECLAMIKALWPGEPVTMQGRFWSLDDVRLAPKPRRANLEFWLGATAPAAIRRVGRIADGWLGAFVSPDEVQAGIAAIKTEAAARGRSIDADHYGTTVFAVRDGLTDAMKPFLHRRPELAVEDHVALGLDATRTLLERFIAAGATKFVLIPVADDPIAWVAELRAAIAPLEAAGLVVG